MILKLFGEVMYMEPRCIYSVLYVHLHIDLEYVYIHLTIHMIIYWSHLYSANPLLHTGS